MQLSKELAIINLKLNKEIELYLTSKPFPESAIGIESESVFLDYANSCGLLSIKRIIITNF
jgi:hypothetical protein